MSRHLTPAERGQLAALLADAGPQEVLGTIAQWIANNVADLTVAGELATKIRAVARYLGTEGGEATGAAGATELCTCSACHQTIRWIPGVLSPPEGAGKAERVCRRCVRAREQAKREGRAVDVLDADGRVLVTMWSDGETFTRRGSGVERIRATTPEAVPAPVTSELSTEEIIESINESTPVVPPWNGWCACPLTRCAPKEFPAHGVFCTRCGRWVRPPGSGRARPRAPDETFCPTCKGEGACGWPAGAPLTVRCTRCDGRGCVLDPIAAELIARALDQAAREGRPITVQRRGRDLATAFPDGATVPPLQYPATAKKGA